MDITDAIRGALFGQMYGADRADAEVNAAFLRGIGVPADEVAGFCRPGLHAGMTLGGAHAADVQSVVEQVLARQRAGSVTLRVAPDRHAEGHLRIEVVEVGPPDTCPSEFVEREEPKP